MKPDNLFLLGNNFKVADFDMACNSGESRNLRAGTLGYMSPEHIARYLNSQPFRRLYAPKLPISDKTEESPACDMWSFGILLWEFTNFPNLHPCHLSQQRLAPNAILSSLTDVHNAKAPTNNPLQELIHGCLQIDPSKRWSSQYALQFWLDSTQPKPVPQLAAPVAADAPKPPPTKPTGNDEKQHDKQSQAKRKDTAADEKEPVKDDKAKTSPSTKSTCLFSTGALVSAVVASVFV